MCVCVCVCVHMVYRWHALALLRTTHNHTSEALDIWESLGTHTLTEDTQHTSPTTPTTAQRAYMELSQTATQVYSAHAPLGQLSVLSAFAQQQQQAVQPHSQSLATRLQQPLFMSVLPDVFERVATVEDSLSEAVGRERGDGVGVTTGPVGQEGGSGGVGQVMSGIQAAGGDQAALAAAAMSALMSYTITDVGTVGSGALAAVSAPTSTGAVAARGVRTASPTYLPELHSVQSSGVRVHMAPSMHPHRAAGRRVAPREAAFGAYLAQSAEWSDVACAGVRLPCMAVPSAPVSTEVVLSKLPWLLTAYPGETYTHAHTTHTRTHAHTTALFVLYQCALPTGALCVLRVSVRKLGVCVCACACACVCVCVLYACR